MKQISNSHLRWPKGRRSCVKYISKERINNESKDLPSFIIKRLPVRLTFDNNYFNALYQGIPVGGYTKMVANLLDGIEVRLNMDYLDNKAELDALADKVVYTGAIDANNITYHGSRYWITIRRWN